MAGERQHVVAVVCSYSGKEDTLRCVASLAEQERSLRLREAGYGVYFVPQARAWHRVSAAHGEYSPNVAYYGTRNNLEVVARHAGRTEPRAQLRLLATAGVHLFHSRRGDDPRENAKSVLAGWRDFRAGRLGKRDG